MKRKNKDSPIIVQENPFQSKLNIEARSSSKADCRKLSVKNPALKDGACRKTSGYKLRFEKRELTQHSIEEKNLVKLEARITKVNLAKFNKLTIT